MEVEVEVGIGDAVLYKTKFGKIRPAIVLEAYEDGSADLSVFAAAQNDPGGSFRNGTRADGMIAYVERAPRGDDVYCYQLPAQIEPSPDPKKRKAA